jgi:MFS family permease
MTDQPAAAPIGVRDLLRIPDFRRLYLAQAISDIGDGMTYLALFLVVLDLTGSTAAIALMSILVALPPVTVGLFAGAWADRHDRRRIMLVSDTLRAVVVGVMVLAATRGAVPVLFALACLQAIIGTFFSPARIAMLPRVVPADGLLVANSIGQATRMVAGVIGAAVTGLIAGLVGVAWPVLVVDAVTFLVSVVLVYGVSREAGIPDAIALAKAKSQGLGGAVADGLRIIAGSRWLVAALGGVSVVMLGVGAINVLFIPFLVNDLGASPAWAGPLEGAQTLSMILAGGLMGGLAMRFSIPRLFVGGIAGLAVCVGLLAVAPGPWALLLVMFAVGWFVMPVQATTMTIVQRSTTDETRGRVAGALNAAIQTASIGSMAVAGILADVTGIRVVFAIGGAVALLAALVAWALFRGEPDAVPTAVPSPV